MPPTPRKPRTDSPYDLYAVVAPGLERITADELRALGCVPTPQPGGVSFTGDLRFALSANLWLRTATRVLLSVDRFRARHLAELERRSRRVAWDHFLRPGTPFIVRASCRRSKIYHQGAAAERVARTIARQLLHRTSPQVQGDAARLGDPAAQPQLVLLRLDQDQAELSLDTSGAPLHRRGYRPEVTRAPLRETLAAAALAWCGWQGEQALADPLCGSGTLPIEACLIAARIPPGRHRTFTLENWAPFDPAWRAVANQQADAGRCNVDVEILGQDRDAGAIDVSRRNAARAGVAEQVSFAVRPVSQAPLDAPGGLLICNPPYGRRIGRPDQLRNLYATLGNLLRRASPGWRLALITADPMLARATGVPLPAVTPPLPHGGQKVRLYRSGPLGSPPGEAT